MKSFFALIAFRLDAAVSCFLKSKAEKTAAAVVVGIGLLSRSLSLHAENEVSYGRGGNNPLFANVCAPTVEAIWITQSGVDQFTVEVTLSLPGWYQFAFFLGGGKYRMQGNGIQHLNSGAQQKEHFGHSVDYFTFPLKSYRGTRDLNDNFVYFDLVRGGEYYYLFFESELDGSDKLVYFRGEHYYFFDHWIDICFYLTGEDNKGRSLFELG